MIPEELFEQIWDALIKLAKSREAIPLNKYRDCWYTRLNEQWELAANSHREPKECERFDPPVTIPPFHFYAAFNGWPAAMISAAHAEIAAGTAANADTLLQAIKMAIGNASIGNCEEVQRG